MHEGAGASVLKRREIWLALLAAQFLAVMWVKHLLGDDQGPASAAPFNRGWTKVGNLSRDARNAGKRGNRGCVPIHRGDAPVTVGAEIAGEVALAAAEVKDRCVAVLGKEGEVVVIIKRLVRRHPALSMTALEHKTTGLGKGSIAGHMVASRLGAG